MDSDDRRKRNCNARVFYKPTFSGRRWINSLTAQLQTNRSFSGEFSAPPAHLAARKALVVQELLENAAGRLDDMIDDTLSELRRHRMGISDHSHIGEPLIVCRPGPRYPLLEDRLANGLSIGGIFQLSDEIHANQLGRDR